MKHSIFGRIKFFQLAMIGFFSLFGGLLIIFTVFAQMHPHRRAKMDAAQVQMMRHHAAQAKLDEAAQP